MSCCSLVLLICPWFRLKAVVAKIDEKLAALTSKKEETGARMDKGVVRELFDCLFLFF